MRTIGNAGDWTPGLLFSPMQTSMGMVLAAVIGHTVSFICGLTCGLGQMALMAAGAPHELDASYGEYFSGKANC